MRRDDGIRRSEWRLIDSGPCAGPYNMALDESVATAVRRGNAPPTLRFYAWERPTVSLGSFQKIADVNLSHCVSSDIPVVRRPTGGRAILHRDELTYSFSSGYDGFFPGGLLDTYRLLSGALKSALETLGLDVTMKTERESGRALARSPLCFKSTSYGELSVGEAKLVGSAQRRWRDGFLQQGSIPYTIDEEANRAVFGPAPSPDTGRGMTGLRDLLPGLRSRELRDAIRESFERTFRIRWCCSGPSREEVLLARELEARRYQVLHEALQQK